MSYKELTLVTCAALGGAMIAEQSLPELIEFSVRVGNSPQTALPCLQSEHYSPKIMSKEHVLACITDLMQQSQCLEEQHSLTFLKASLRDHNATHFWVA